MTRPAPHNLSHPAILALVVAAALTITLLASAASAGAARTANTKQLTVYSTLVNQQYVDNNDDEARGDVNNPFGTHNTKASKAIDEHLDGPFPGDEAFFSFTVYTDKTLTKKAGAAVFTCQYYFNQHAFCDASFQMTNGGTMVGAGTFDFNATKYAIAITGGYGTYDKATGDVEATATTNTKHPVQTLAFTLN